MDYWSVHVEARADGSVSAAVTDDAVDRFADLLERHHGVASGGTGYASWGATISVEAPSAPAAVTEGTRVVARLADEAALPGWPVDRAEAVREDVLDEELAHPVSSYK